LDELLLEDSLDELVLEESFDELVLEDSFDEEVLVLASDLPFSDLAVLALSPLPFEPEETRESVL
jgi:hypothetical protein